jgi:4'-phosphopantetheinyl transferase
MDAPGWLSQRLAEVPSGNEWLGENERRVLAGLRMERRRADWRLGRWTAKAALGGWLQVAPGRIEVLAAADGAPEAWLDDKRMPLSVSLSHRGGRALAAVGRSPQIAGCDLELVEPRSDAFVREWLALEEQRVIFSCAEGQRALLANMIWTAKEAAAKVRREGLRLDVRRAVVRADTGGQPDRWRELRVDWDDGEGATAGWWRAEPGWVMVVACEPPSGMPRAISCFHRA